MKQFANQIFVKMKGHALMSFFLILICGCILFFTLFHWLVMPRQLFRDSTSTVLLDKNGALLGARIAADGQWRFPETDSLNEKFITCLIQYEDKRFYRHLGVDPIAILRACKHNMSGNGRREGGSTLTMQVARMARGNQPRTVWNKIVEIFWAIDIELTHSKEEILRLYLSHAPFGGNIVGLDAATWRYCNREISRLSWAEMCCLAVLPNSPSLIHLSRNRSELQKKRDGLLRTLHENGFITEEELTLALEEPLPDKPYAIPNNAMHYLDFLSKKNNGKQIKTDIDSRLQTMVQRLANDYARSYHNSNHIDNIAILVLDVETGNPIAYVGNTTDMSVEAWQVDIVQSERSPGSTLKPFLYAAMISSGEITPRQLISDTPLSINGFTPSNFSHTFSGAVHADDAIVQSLNVPLVRMLMQHGPGRFMEDLKWLGMNTLHYNEDHYGASLILGGVEVKLWDLCQMYRKLSVQLQSKEKDTEECRLTKPAIWYAIDAMSKLNRPEEEAEWSQFRSMKNIAWKTGTSWGSRDAWSVGVTPKYVVGVWTGNATGEGRAGMTGVGYASPVMFDVFALLENSEWFVKPTTDMETMVVCRQSGCLATENCAFTDTVFLPSVSAQTTQCPYCRIVHISTDGLWQVNSQCVTVDEFQTKQWFVLPAAQEYYYKTKHADYHVLPPFREDCDYGNADQIDFIYPEHNATIFVPRGFDGSLEHVVFEAVNRKPNTVLFWHLDTEYIGKTEGSHKLGIIPPKGDHVLSIVDEKGNRRAILIHVI